MKCNDQVLAVHPLESDLTESIPCGMFSHEAIPWVQGLMGFAQMDVFINVACGSSTSATEMGRDKGPIRRNTLREHIDNVIGWKLFASAAKTGKDDDCP